MGGERRGVPPRSMRNSYTVTLPEEPPVSPFSGMPKELRTKTPMPGSLLVSAFVGLVLNKTKVQLGFTPNTHIILMAFSKLGLARGFPCLAGWTGHKSQGG